jgi:hypothetical protein
MLIGAYIQGKQKNNHLFLQGRKNVNIQYDKDRIFAMLHRPVYITRNVE